MKDYWNLAWGPSPYGGTSTQAFPAWQGPVTTPRTKKEQKKMDKQTVEQVVEDLVTVTGAKAAIVTIFSTLTLEQKTEVRDWFESDSYNW